MKVGIFVDTVNLFKTVGRRFNGGKLNFNKIFEKGGIIKEDDVVSAFAYGQRTEKSIGFETCLKYYGYITKFRDTDYLVELVVDIMKMFDKFDLVLICSSDPILESLVEHLSSCGVSTHIYGVNIPRNLKQHTNNFTEVNENDLEVKESESVVKG